ncbi:FMN-binding negative transcriptional regulator [Croceicoccus sp. BE223]|uniref:FMN-binding negative transcriptional regulator n=1 Tax=Croceicoccus sp. BE223 TaxID=2817716 RepID=UPI002860B451|nr:FMN-binding negative transcriptional regulator [Croceicoccus sp. BE223]MDR7101816.1 transcriptional regulator [Croceicoccus sp. BE223]
MHPNAAFRHDDRALHLALIDEVGFGTIFAQTADGPRVAHAPLLRLGEDRVQFHLSRGNALTRHLAGAEALAVVNGPDGYVSPRWYADQQQVPTWNYLALEMEGCVTALPAEALAAHLDAVTAREEGRFEGDAWTTAKMDPARLARMREGIVGFELAVGAWRPTFKLSQNKPADERARVIEGLEGRGARGLAALMRTLVP